MLATARTRDVILVYFIGQRNCQCIPPHSYFLRLHHLSSQRPASPKARTEIMDVEFDPDRCAELHNQLLAKTIESIPGAQVERNMITRVREEIPEEAPWLLQVDEEYADSFTAEDLPFYRFFSQMDTCTPTGRRLPLSAEYMQPEPRWFYNKSYPDDDDERHIILLYPDQVEDSPVDGGLFLDLGTWWVTWCRLDRCRGLPKDVEAWVPLELALRKSIDMYDRGKYDWLGHPQGRDAVPRLRSWTPGDLEYTIQKWEAYLGVLSERLPSGDSELKLEDPLPASLVNSFQISPFAKAFLAAARRPVFQLIAPGLTTFNADSFSSLMGSETAEAPRRKFIARMGDDVDVYPSLVLPAASSLGDIPVNPPAPPAASLFETDAGVGKFTVMRRAGLYTEPMSGAHAGDASLLITGEGADQPVDFAFSRPWGTHRAPTFAEAFELWTHYVREGIWEVGADGVVTPHSWFTDPATKEERVLYWNENAR